MQHGFVRPEIEPISHPVLISFCRILACAGRVRAIPYTFMTVWILVAAAVWKRLPDGSIFRDLLPLTGIYIVVRLVMFPNFDDRFFVWAYLLAGVALIRTAQNSPSDVPENDALHPNLQVNLEALTAGGVIDDEATLPMSDSQPNLAANSEVQRLQIGCWVGLIAVAAVRAWFTRYELGGDGMSYLDIARAVAAEAIPARRSIPIGPRATLYSFRCLRYSVPALLGVSARPFDECADIYRNARMLISSSGVKCSNGTEARREFLKRR